MRLLMFFSQFLCKCAISYSTAVAFHIFCNLLFSDRLIIIRGPGSSVGIATGCGLDGPGIESRLGARFSALVQTGPGAHPASCTMGIWSFPEVKSGRRVTLTPHSLLVPWSWKGRAILLLPLWAVGLHRASVPVQGYTLHFYYCSSDVVSDELSTSIFGVNEFC